MKVGPIELGEPVMEVRSVPIPLRKGRWWEKLQRWLAVRIEHWSLTLAAHAKKWQRRGEWE